MAAASLTMAMDDLVEDLQLHEVILQSLDEQRPYAVEERQEIVDIINDLQTKLAELRGDPPRKSQQNLSVQQSTPTPSPAGSISQVDGGYDASPFYTPSHRSPLPSPSQQQEGESHHGQFPIRKRRLSESSNNAQPPVKRPQANDAARSNAQIQSSQDDDLINDGAEELRMLLGLDDEDMIAFQDEQRQAEEELRKRKEQERRDAEFARVLHESVFDQPQSRPQPQPQHHRQPPFTSVPVKREPEPSAVQDGDEDEDEDDGHTIPMNPRTPDGWRAEQEAFMASLGTRPRQVPTYPGPSRMSTEPSPFMHNTHPVFQDNRLKPHTMAQPLPNVSSRLIQQEDSDDDIREIQRSEFQPSNRVYANSYTPPAFARPGMLPVKHEIGMNPYDHGLMDNPNSLRSTMARLSAGRQMLQEAGKSMWGGLPKLYNSFGPDPMRDAIHSLSSASPSNYIPQLEGYDVDPRKTKEEIKKLLETIRPDMEIAQQNREGTPEALKVTLLEHQKVGLTWMKSMEESVNKGGILADDMGLGKTLQAIALMVTRPSTDPMRKTTLVIAPVALMQQWKREIEKLLRPGKYQLSVFILHGEKRKATFKDLKQYDVVLTTFGTLSSELKRKEKYEELHNQSGTTDPLPKAVVDMLPCLGPGSKWYRVIIDEAQCIKNRTTKSALACCQIDSTYRWCMSGTPMMNNVEELHSLIKFLRIRPYNSLERFNNEFTRPLKREGGSMFDHAMKQLQVLLKAILLRRTKYSKIDGKPILQLPPRVSEKVHAVFDEDERQLYSALESKSQIQFSKYLDNGSIGRNYSDILVLLLRLRQTCCHPHLMSDFSVKVGTNTNAADIDLVQNAKAFGEDIIVRLRDNPNLECPICIDAVDNPTIFFPCGHSTCAECFARISDPRAGVEQGNDGAVEVKCPNCRARIDIKKITDHVTFKKVHFPDPFDEENDTTETPEKSDETPESSDDESDSDEEGEGDLSKFIVRDNGNSKGKGKGKMKMGAKKSLAQLKKEGSRNQKAKRKYIRRLEKKWVSSAKIDKTLEILQEIEDRNDGQKTIIFSQFTSLLDLLEVPIARRGWGYRRYDGSMRPQDRNSAVLDFTDQPNCKIMLVSLKAGNAGLNLIAASQVIIFDPFWNPYIEEQAIDRAHRIGQQREVQIHRILVEQTVEDRILELQDKKRNLIEGALDENASKSLSRLGARELGYLFGVNV